jgi:hypothetical protein
MEHKRAPFVSQKLIASSNVASVRQVDPSASDSPHELSNPNVLNRLILHPSDMQVSDDLHSIERPKGEFVGEFVGTGLGNAVGYTAGVSEGTFVG